MWSCAQRQSLFDHFTRPFYQIMNTPAKTTSSFSMTKSLPRGNGFQFHKTEKKTKFVHESTTTCYRKISYNKKKREQTKPNYRKGGYSTPIDDPSERLYNERILECLAEVDDMAYAELLEYLAEVDTEVDDVAYTDLVFGTK